MPVFGCEQRKPRTCNNSSMGKPRPKAKLCPGKARSCPGKLKDNNMIIKACPGKLKKNWALKFTENVDSAGKGVHVFEETQPQEATPLDYSMRSNRKDVNSAPSTSPQVCGSSPSAYGVSSSQSSSDATSSPELKMPFDHPYFPAPLYHHTCLLYTSPSPRDDNRSRMPSSA